MEKYAEYIYNLVYKEVVKIIGNDTTDSIQLYDISKKLLGDKFIGVYASDEIPKLKNGQYAILNLDKSNMAGSHWVAICKFNNKVFFYDSFGRSYKTIIKVLKDSDNGEIINSDKDAEQEIKANDCGARSIAMLLFFDKYGYEYAKYI
jgi:hypothetical protein